MSVVALCNTEVESPHLLAVGGNIGSIDVIDLAKRTSLAAFTEMHTSNVLGLSFHGRDHILSYDQSDFLHIDLESGNRRTLFPPGTLTHSFTFFEEASPIIAATRENLYVCDLRAEPVILIAQDNITEVCLLPDEWTLAALQFNALVVTDIRNPIRFQGLNIPQSFQKLSCNRSYLAAVTDVPQLFCFDLPLSLPPVELCTYESPIVTRPTFAGDYIAIGDSSGSIFVIDPGTQNVDILQIPQPEVIVSLAGNPSEIVAALEDEIYVFSHFPHEDNLIRPIEGDMLWLEEEEEPEAWLAQTEVIQVEPGECTYERYGYCDQQVFVCRTCMVDGSRPFGVCEQCAQICHLDHDVRPIGVRRRFRCDCGNQTSSHPCRTMCAPKTFENPRNRYSHNFNERWCVCDSPDRRDEPMVQCFCCDDWFHHRCIGMFSESQCILLEAVPELRDWVFVCAQCLAERLAFLENLPDGDIPPIVADFVAELRRDYEIAPAGDPSREGIGFRIFGGRWMPKDRFMGFVGVPEFDEQYAALDTREEDAAMPPARGQEEFARVFRDLYTGLFARMEQSGRKVVQRDRKSVV
jgi:E3 ubiquitin-protein ligase UBR7